MSIAQFIDHTILKPTTTVADIKKICEEANEYQFAAVCVPPFYVSHAGRFLANTKVGIATVIGFPFGYNYIPVKVKEVKKAIKDGAGELDMVINIAALKNDNINYLEQEIEMILEITQAHNKTLKLIIESGILSDSEIIKCCEFYGNYPIQFLKTSTGYAEKGATIEAVRLMRTHLPPSIQIKASGGIKSYTFAKGLIDAGATRLGSSASITIVNNEPVGNSGY